MHTLHENTNLTKANVSNWVCRLSWVGKLFKQSKSTRWIPARFFEHWNWMGVGELPGSCIFNELGLTKGWFNGHYSAFVCAGFHLPSFVSLLKGFTTHGSMSRRTRIHLLFILSDQHSNLFSFAVNYDQVLAGLAGERLKKVDGRWASFKWHITFELLVWPGIMLRRWW